MYCVYGVSFILKNAKYLTKKNILLNSCISIFLHKSYLKKISFMDENMNEKNVHKVYITHNSWKSC